MTTGKCEIILSGLGNDPNLLFEPISQIRSHQQYHDYYSMLREITENFNVASTPLLFHKRAVYAILFSDTKCYVTVDDLYETFAIELSIDVDIATYLRLKYPKFIRIV